MNWNDTSFQHYDDGEEVDVKYFVGGLPVRCQADEINYAFSQWGAVTDAIVIKDPATQRTRGFGFVTIRAKRDVHTLVQIQSHTVAGKKVSVKEAKVEGNVSQKLFCKNLCPEHTEEEITKYFRKFGGIDQVHIAKDGGPEDGMCAYVTFVNAEAVKEALNANSEFSKQFVCGKELEVRKYMTSRGGGQLDRSGRGARVVPNSGDSTHSVADPDWWGSNAYGSGSAWNCGYGMDAQYSGSTNFDPSGCWFPGYGGGAGSYMPGYAYQPSMVLPEAKIEEADKTRSSDSSSSDSSSSTAEHGGSSARRKGGPTNSGSPRAKGTPSKREYIKEWQNYIRASGGLAPDAGHLESWLRASGAIPSRGEPEQAKTKEQSKSERCLRAGSRSRSGGSRREKRGRCARSQRRRSRGRVHRKSSRRRASRRACSRDRSSEGRRQRQSTSRDRPSNPRCSCNRSPSIQPAPELATQLQLSLEDLSANNGGQNASDSGVSRACAHPKCTFTVHSSADVCAEFCCKRCQAHFKAQPEGEADDHGQTCEGREHEAGIVRRLSKRDLSPPLFSRSRSSPRGRRHKSDDGVSV